LNAKYADVTKLASAIAYFDEIGSKSKAVK
jgi:hypothetical protein